MHGYVREGLEVLQRAECIKESGDVETRTHAGTDSTECADNNLLAGFVIPLQVRDHSTNSEDRDEVSIDR